MRVAVVNTHPIQYYAPLYAYLSKDSDIQLTVFYLTDFSTRGSVDKGFGKVVKWDIDLLSGYEYQFIGRHYRTAIPDGFFSLVVPGLFFAILRGKFDAVLVYGYAHAANLIAITAARVSGSRVLFRADTNGLLAKSRRHSILKQLYVKGVFAACDSMLTIGARNREFYRWMGVPEHKLMHAPFVVDNDRFRSASRLSQTERLELRRWLGVTDQRPALLFVSKFLPGKNPHLVVEAAGHLAKEGKILHLVMAGSGEMESELRTIASRFPDLSVSFPGFVNQSKMPSLFAACDAFVFPSATDPWGLIVNEAMAAGLPVIVGAESGCAPDLVEDGVNGFLVHADDLDALKEAMSALVDNGDLRRQMGDASLRRIGTWSFREYHAGWRSALGLPPLSKD